MTSKPLYRWIRDLHLYFGLFISPFVLVFAISTLFLNHVWKPWEARSPSVTRVSPPIPEGLPRLQVRERLDAIRSMLPSLGISGEVDHIRYLPAENRMVIPVSKPGEQAVLDLNLQSGQATLSRRATGFWEALVYLHRSPGPHNVGIRGNWSYMRHWKVLADTIIYLLLFVSASGIYLWAVLKAERKIGLILLGAGGISFVALIAGLSG